MLLGLHFARLGRLFKTLGSKVWPGLEKTTFYIYILTGFPKILLVFLLGVAVSRT